MTALRVLFVEDRPDDAVLLAAELTRAGFDPLWSRIETMAELIIALEQPPDVVITDYSLPDMDALDVLRTIRALGLYLPVIVVSGVMDEQTCVQAVRLGADDYLLKDRLTRLGSSLERALAQHRLAEEARRARREEREAMNLLIGLVNHAPAAIGVRAAADGGHLLSNRSYARLHPKVGGSWDAADLPTEAHQTEEVHDGRTYVSIAYPVSGESGEVFAVGSIHVDITGQKQIEADLRVARAELQAHADQLDARNTVLQELDDLKSEFVACVSHELRTPLTSICGYIEMLTDGAFGPLDDGANNALEIIERNTQRLLRLIDDLLLLSHLDSGGGSAQMQPVGMADLVATVVEVLQPALETAGVQLVVDLPATLPPVHGDRGQLERVLFNLLSNAVKFSHRGGIVAIRGHDDEGALVLTFEDQGIGIPTDELPQLFGRFHRGETARRMAIPGTGLGLAVVRGLVDNHDGEISVQSVLGEGTCITLRLPLSARDRRVARALR